MDEKKPPRRAAFCTIELNISSKQRWQQQKQPQERPKRLPKQQMLELQQERLPKLRKQLPKLRMQLRQQQVLSYRKRPERWQRSAKPAGATFSCLCPQKECQ
jgi:hypothetical protein